MMIIINTPPYYPSIGWLLLALICSYIIYKEVYRLLIPLDMALIERVNRRRRLYTRLYCRFRKVNNGCQLIVTGALVWFPVGLRVKTVGQASCYESARLHRADVTILVYNVFL